MGGRNSTIVVFTLSRRNLLNATKLTEFRKCGEMYGFDGVSASIPGCWWIVNSGEWIVRPEERFFSCPLTTVHSPLTQAIHVAGSPGMPIGRRYFASVTG